MHSVLRKSSNSKLLQISQNFAFPETAAAAVQKHSIFQLAAGDFFDAMLQFAKSFYMHYSSKVAMLCSTPKAKALTIEALRAAVFFVKLLSS